MALRPLYYDTETTGIQPQNERIIEIAVYDPVQNRTYESLINPGKPIPKEATAVHNITDQMVANAPSFAQVAIEFFDFCQGDTVLVAHNNDSFDLPFLKEECKRNNLEMPDFKTFDTLKWVRKYRPDFPRHSLQFLREALEIPPNQAHRALDDVKVLHEVFSFFIDDLPWEQVYTLMKQGNHSMRMPFGKYQGKALAEVPKDYVRWLKGQGVFDKPENKELKECFEKHGILTPTKAN
jgi:DNA polymerase-3 subunit epsilon